MTSNSKVWRAAFAFLVAYGVVAGCDRPQAGGGGQAKPPAARPQGPLPDVPAPNGFTVVDHPEGGRVLSGTFRGTTRSATIAARGLLGSLADYFDRAPDITDALRDGADQQIQMFFSAAIKSVPVAGVLGLALTGGGGSVSLLFDHPNALASSFARLRGSAESAKAPPAPPRVEPLAPVSLADGSRISLPQSWRVSDSGKGMVTANGPNGELVSLGTHFTVQSVGRLNPVHGGLVAPCCDLARLAVILPPQVAMMMSGGRVREAPPVRVIESRPDLIPNGEARWALTDSVQMGTQTIGFEYTMAMNTGNPWLFYTSGVSAPSSIAAQKFPTLMAIWKSWSINPAVFAGRLDDATKAMNETGRLARGAQQNAERASMRQAEGWDEYIRGVQTVEGPNGTRRQVDNSISQKLVDSLNARGSGGWRIVPPSEIRGDGSRVR